MEYSIFSHGITHPDVTESRTARDVAELIEGIKGTNEDAAWAPAVFDPPRRLTRNVRQVHALVFDVDGKHAPSGTLRHASNALSAFAHATHTTRSHRSDAHSFRIIIALSRPVSASEHRALWGRLRSSLAAGNVFVDIATKDPSRAWFVPRRDAEVIVSNGEALDVDDTLARSSPSAAEKALACAEEAVRKAREGERNATLFDQVRKLRSRVASGVLDESSVRTRMAAAARAAGIGDEETTATIESALREPPTASGLPRIMTSGGDYARVIDEVTAALPEIANLYTRGRMLVQVLARDRAARAPAVRTLSPTMLRYELTRVREFVTRTREGVRATWPADAILAGVLEAQSFPGVCPLLGILESPSMDPNGRILDANGYDASTKLFVSADDVSLNISPAPTAEDAREAFRAFDGLFADFPFSRRAEDLSVVVAAILTLVGRAAFSEQAPMFAISANTRGSGKTLLTELLMILALGRRVPMTPLPANDEECAKLIGAFLRDGSNVLIFDNVDGPVRLPTLDGLITSSEFSVRELGANRRIEAPNRIVVFLNGNSLQLRGDLSRRALPIELETLDERPEMRSRFRHADIRAHVLARRSEYVSAALTMLLAHHCAGRPSYPDTYLGGFTGWSAIIPSAIVFAGGVSPVKARAGRATVADRDAETLGRLLEAFEGAFEDASVTLARVAERCYPLSGVSPGPAYAELRDVLDEIAPTSGRAPNLRVIGNFINKHEKKRVGCRRFVSDGRGHAGLRKWRVERCEPQETDSPSHPDGGTVGSFNGVGADGVS